MGQGQAVGGQGMGVAGGIEIDPQSFGLGPIDPGRVVGRLECVPIDLPPARFGVHRVQVDAMGAGHERQGRCIVGAQFIGCAGLAGVVAGDRQAAAHVDAQVFKTGVVVALPAVQRDGHLGQLLEGPIGVDAQVGVALLRRCIRGFDMCGVISHRTLAFLMTKGWK